MSCTSNYIGIKGYCGDDVPSSNLYINHLPGITLEKAANTAEGVLNTGIALLQQSIAAGIARVRQELIGAMLGEVRFNQIISGGEYGEFGEDFLAVAPSERGAKGKLESCCRLGAMFIPRVKVLFNTTATGKTIGIIDGGTVTTYTFDVVAEVPQYIETNYKATTGTIYILTDNTAMSPNDSQLITSGCGFCNDNCCHTNSCECTTGLTVTGWDGSAEASTTYGIRPTIQVICDSEKFFCEIAHLEMVEWASLYASGIEFLRFNQQTNRINVYTLYEDAEEVNAIIADWEAKLQYRLQKLTETLPKYLNSIDKCCLECNRSTWEYAQP